jgi:hypothetical protein
MGECPVYVLALFKAAPEWNGSRLYGLVPSLIRKNQSLKDGQDLS